MHCYRHTGTHILPGHITNSDVGIPEHWSDMGQQEVLVVPLQPADPEYIAVASKFNETCADFSIKKIERIQNIHLWNIYQTQKKLMNDKNHKATNEKQLFHGTHADSVPQINTKGFNRTETGMNGKMYGEGTYFTVNARFSANYKYSNPDTNGQKHMYYVRVLTGVYTHGHQGLIRPPRSYDSVTNNVRNPRLFVVFQDCQSYPEYLITFTE